MDDTIEFVGSLPDIQGSVKFGGVDGESRIQIDIPAVYKEQAKSLVDMTGMAFKVTIEALDD